MKTAGRFITRNPLSILLDFPPLTLVTGLASFRVPV